MNAYLATQGLSDWLDTDEPRPPISVGVVAHAIYCGDRVRVLNADIPRETIIAALESIEPGREKAEAFWSDFEAGYVGSMAKWIGKHVKPEMPDEEEERIIIGLVKDLFSNSIKPALIQAALELGLSKSNAAEVLAKAKASLPTK